MIQRQKRMDGVQDFWEGEYTYRCILTNDYDGAKTGHIRIGDNPINAYCFGNAILDFDNLENCKPIKIRQTQKIDGVITVLMCVRQFIDYER